MYFHEGAQHIGRRHWIDYGNKQDVSQLLFGMNSSVGVICDGCSEGAHSETGAALAAKFFTSEALVYLENTSKDPGTIAERVGRKLDQYLLDLTIAQTWNTDAEYVHFVQNHLLFTVVGFITRGSDVALFYAGDGTLWIDDERRDLNPGDTPMYPAYRLIPDAVPKGLIVPELQVECYHNPKRFAIGSDAWKEEPDIDMWALHPLQREINRLSRVDHRFGDDVSIIRCTS